MKAAVYTVNGSSANRQTLRSRASVASSPVVERPSVTHTGESSGPSESRRRGSVVQAAAGRFSRKGPLHIWDVPKDETFETADGRRSTRVVWTDVRKAGQTGAKKSRKLKTAGSKETNEKLVGLKDMPTDIVGIVATADAHQKGRTQAEAAISQDESPEEVELKVFGKRAPTPSARA
ncbi:hypothetical protein FRC10_000608 [Ceratobasidium sp. 414]|nr:hypothetical protein FRC10_000608 [Ceratobasidium sp. 414]